MSVVIIGVNGLFEVVDGSLLRREAAALLVIQPPKLLENLGMSRGVFQNLEVGSLGAIEL